MYNVIEILDTKEFNKLKSSLSYYRISSGTNLFINNIEKTSKEQFLEKIGIKSNFQTYYEKNNFIEKINSSSIKIIEDISLLYLGSEDFSNATKIVSNDINGLSKEKEKSMNNYDTLLKILNVVNTDIMDENLKNVMTYLGYVDIIKIFCETIGENSIYSTNKIDSSEKIKDAINIIHKNSNKLSNDLKNYITSFEDFSIKSIMIDFFNSLMNPNYIFQKRNFNDVIKSNMNYLLCLFLKACGFTGFIKTNITNEINFDELCILQDSTNIIRKFETLSGASEKLTIKPEFKKEQQKVKLSDETKNLVTITKNNNLKKGNCYLRYVAYKKKF